MLLDAGYDQNKYTSKYSTEDLDNKSVLIKGAFSQEITDSLGIKLSAGTSASEKFNTELQINWKIVNGIALYVKGGYSQIDYKQNGLTDQYGNVWTGGIGLEWTFGGVAKSAPRRDETGKPSADTSENRKSAKMAPARLLQEVATNPAIRSTRVNAAVDQSTTRLVAIDKTALPSGTTLDQQTGDIHVTVSAGTITGITRNGSAFANTGQFTMAGTTFTVHALKITAPAA